MPRIAVVAGAGWSKAAGWPDTTEILDHPAWLVGAAAAGRYEAVWKAYDGWRGGDPARTGDIFMAEVLDGRVRTVSWPMVVEVIAGTIASAGATLSPAVSPRYADSLMRPNLHPSHQAFFEEVLATGGLIGVVSLNYDLLVEKVLRPGPMRRPRRPGFHYGGLPRPQVCIGRSSSPFPRDRAREPLALTGSAPVLKVHGSLNWHVNSWGPITIYPDLRAAFRARGQAAIIPPVVRPTSVPPYLADVWSGAESLLSSVDEWWVAGYSLPEADANLRAMLVRAAANGALKRIYVRNKTERTRPRWEAVAGRVPVDFGGSL